LGGHLECCGSLLDRRGLVGRFNGAKSEGFCSDSLRRDDSDFVVKSRVPIDKAPRKP
jgi:hypothetical protein